MDNIDTIVIGAGQAGLASGYQLKRRDIPFLILESSGRIGDGWRRHWDSLRLFTPGRYSSLPGLRTPVGRSAFATKDELADYLQAYAARFDLPLRLGVSVTGVAVTADGFELTTTAGPLRARHVVVASGPNRIPRVPAFASRLDPGIRQMHSSEYRNPQGVPAGDVLVVGAGTSGAQIALELAATRRVSIAGRPTVRVPDAVLRYAGAAYWFLLSNVLTIGTPPGRKVATVFGKRGAPLINISMEQLAAAGVTRLPRISGVEDGLPVAGENGVVTAATIIWATGYRPDLAWLPPLPVTEEGTPVTRRGLVTELPGLYFVGMPYQYGLTSGLIGGVGRDADFIAGLIAAAQSASPTKSAETGTTGAPSRLPLS